jgi:hypothetical protein
MAINKEVYTTGGAPSNMQVASVKVATVDFSALNDGVGTAIGDDIHLFDIDPLEVVLSAGWAVMEAGDATLTLDIGTTAVPTLFGTAEDGAAEATVIADALPTLGDGDTVQLVTKTVPATTGRVKVWCVVALVADPQEPVPASVRTPPVTP